MIRHHYPTRKLLWRIPLLVVSMPIAAAIWFPNAALFDFPGIRTLKVACLCCRAKLGGIEGRQRAVMALRRMGSKGRAAIPMLKEALYDPDNGIRGSAAFALETMGTNALPVLLEALRSKNPSVISAVLGTFGKIGQPAVPGLAAAFRDKDPEVSQAAEWALSLVGPAAVPAFEEALKDQDSAIRVRAASTLNRSFGRSGQAVSALVAASKDPKPEVRANAASALGGAATGNAAALQALLEALRDDDATVRTRAANALGRVGGPGIPGILEILKNERQEVRKDATFALALMGPAALDAVDALIQIVREEAASANPIDPGPMARFALAKIGKSAVPPLIDLLREGNPRSCEIASITLAQMGTNAVEAVPTLIGLLNDPKESVRRVALYALGAIGPGAREAAPLLAAKLADPQQQTLQVRTACALLSIDPQSQISLDHLLAAARGESPDDRALALEVFTKVPMKSPEMITELLKGLADSDIGVRVAAANAFYRMGKAAVPLLVKALDDPDLDVRREVEVLLLHVSPKSLKEPP